MLAIHSRSRWLNSLESTLHAYACALRGNCECFYYVTQSPSYLINLRYHFVSMILNINTNTVK